MGRLLILRHAKAEPHTGDDHERALAPRGHEDAARLGTFLLREKLVPSLAVVSTARRAQETWASVLTTLGQPPKSKTEPRLYNATAGTILDVIRNLPDEPAVAIVAHNPGLHEIACRLVSNDDTQAQLILGQGLPTCGLVVIDFPGHWAHVAWNGGHLVRFVTPSMF